ncbi:hypothetical protein BJ684DRAFT_15544 [Piptocephalis cylindrospora]|uniref:Uncharacterized protein n=1 Tax=Piptocephalis cylindrospora TaxID=1907219 RepID=A0A4P9Y5U4_9FUNG|nr:hypothetical protein BJ684DRAFT_15544 [Piptocephalis cylindrospora]|eukprot:RKP14112.1 hypothetical protein BJ684DRAFT_15544 [Piptocephalis cylindrospora]
MSVDHHHTLHSPSHVPPILRKDSPHNQNLYVWTSMGEDADLSLSRAEQKEKFHPYDQIYAGLFFMISAQIGKRLLFNKAAKQSQYLARDACDKIRAPTKSSPADPLFLRAPGSLIDIYCTVMKRNFNGDSYVPIVKAFHEAIGYSRFHDMQGGHNPFIDVRSKLVINTLIMERFYLLSHIPFHSLEGAISSLHAVMHIFFDRIPIDGKPTDAELAGKFMVKRLSMSKSSASDPRVQSNTYHAFSPSHLESPVPFVKYFGDLFPPTDFPPMSNDRFIYSMRKMCKEVTNAFPGVKNQHIWRGRKTFIRKSPLNSSIPLYFTICAHDHFQKSWSSKNGHNWYIDYNTKRLFNGIPQARFIGKYLEEWIYKVRFLQLVRFLQPLLVKLPMADEEWSATIDAASRRIRSFVTSIYIHSVLWQNKLSEDPDVRKMYRDMLDSISDASFVTWGEESERKALASFKVRIPEATKMEGDMTRSYRGKFNMFWTRLSRWFKSPWTKARREAAWAKWCKMKASKVLDRALTWASTPEGRGVPKNPAKAFAHYAVALKGFLLEANKGRPMEITDGDLSPESMKGIFPKETQT